MLFKIWRQIIGKRNGKGREYNYKGELKFEGEYLNGERNGKGKEYNYDGQLRFESEYANRERNGKGYKYYCNFDNLPVHSAYS